MTIAMFLIWDFISEINSILNTIYCETIYKDIFLVFSEITVLKCECLKFIRFYSLDRYVLTLDVDFLSLVWKISFAKINLYF